MLRIDTFEEKDLSRVTNIYVSGVFSSKLDQFLNTTQTGFAQELSGTEVSILSKALFTALCLCTLQLTLFCFFRPIMKSLYQPRCYYVPTSERMKPLPQGLLSWILPTVKNSTNDYLNMGLDTYFFVRFISIQLLYFITIGLLNMLVLLPINWTGSNYQYSALGMDKLSISNIANTKVWRLNAHLIMSIITIGFFHILLIHELDTFVNIRQSYLMSPIHKNSIVAKSLLIANVPLNLRDVEVIIDLFAVIPGGIKSVWLSYDFVRIKNLVDKANDAVEFLETSHIKYLQKHMKQLLLGNNLLYWKKFNDDKLKSIVDAHKGKKFDYDVNKSDKFYPPIYLDPIKIPYLDRTFSFKFPGCLRILAGESRQLMVEWATHKLQRLHLEIEQEKFLLNNYALKTHDKVIVEFGSQIGASIALQCLLSKEQGSLNQCMIEVNPNDILWENIARKGSIIAFLEKYLASMLFICITILYIIPVSFIGLVSQIPLIIHILPFLSWINNFPEEVRDTFSKLLPSILLSILTELVMVTFRFLSYFKGKQTGAEREADLQNWYFAFLFIQQFLVITILSSITFIFKQIMDQPTSIPILLAVNLPKAGTFFLQYLTVKALTFCGNNFLRIDQLILRLTVHKIYDRSPRKKFKRLTSLIKIKWGTIYPVYSIYCSIGLVYTIISPSISVFLILILSLVLLYYKYALKFIYSHVNDSETHGILYPVALLQLYSGIYCLETCMIGMFFLLKDENGNCPLRVQGYLMFIALLLTFCGNMIIYKRYSRYFSYTPVLPEKSNVEQNSSSVINNHGEDQDQIKEIDDYYLNKKLLYLHPAFKYEIPSLWLPEDPLGISESQINYSQEKVSCLKGGLTKGASIDFKWSYFDFKIKIFDSPPGYK